MVCLGNMCVDTLRKGVSDDDDDDDDNKENKTRAASQIGDVNYTNCEVFVVIACVFTSCEIQ
jgi:hypothetical protein